MKLAEPTKAKFTYYQRTEPGYQSIPDECVFDLTVTQSIQLKGRSEAESMTVEMGFHDKNGPYVTLWLGAGLLNPTWIGRFYLREQLTLRKLAGGESEAR